MKEGICSQPAPDCRYPEDCEGYGSRDFPDGPCYCCEVTKHKGLHECDHHKWEGKKMCCTSELGTKENPHPVKLQITAYYWGCQECSCINTLAFNNSLKQAVACLNCGVWHKQIVSYSIK